MIQVWTSDYSVCLYIAVRKNGKYILEIKRKDDDITLPVKVQLFMHYNVLPMRKYDFVFWMKYAKHLVSPLSMEMTDLLILAQETLRGTFAVIIFADINDHEY